MTDRCPAQDRLLRRRAGVDHPDGAVDVTLQQIVIVLTRDHLEEPPGDQHPGIRVADVLARVEERRALA
jgi:hypothetical protein